MKRSIIILFLLFSLLSCRGQDFIDWVESGNPPCTEGNGLLYNWYAATDARNISSSDDWILPAITNYQTLVNTLGAGGNWTGNTVGDSVKESGTTYWNSGNNGTNAALFNARGSGQRSGAGVYAYKGVISDYWTTTEMDATTYSSAYLTNSASYFYVTIGHGNNIKLGTPIRLLYTGAGTPTEYVDNSGNVYRVVTIGGQTWLADNLRDVRFRNGDIIPYHGADNGNNFTNAEWAALTTAGVCAYNNDVANVGCNFTFPTE